MGGDASGSNGRRVFKALSTLVLIIFTWLLLIGILGSSDSVAATVSSPGKPRHVWLGRRGQHSFSWNPDFVYVSRRRVPNGPDPIHNRHIGETRRPSGRF